MADVNPEIRIFESPDALNRAAADMFVESSAEAVAHYGRFLVALSGGSTPIGTYELLAGAPYREQVDWIHTHVFWGDERCVPREDLENNYREVNDILLSHTAIPAGSVHRIQSDLAPQDAADDYARILQLYATPPLQWPRFDLVLLGLGSDGHTASLFPGSEVSVASPTLAVTGHYQNRPAQRVTLSPLVFNTARRIAFLVSGEAKAGILAEVLHGERHPEALPAQRIAPVDGSLIWMVDRAAASQL